MNPMQILAAQPWVARLGLTLVHFLWQGVIIVAIYAAARRWGARTLGPNGRYFLACVALAAMVVAPVITWILLREPSAEVVAATFTAPWSTARTGVSRSISLSLPIHADRALPGTFLPWVVAFWLTGATTSSLRLLGRWILAQRVRSTRVRPASAEWQRTLDRLKTRVSVSRPVRLFVSGLLEAPAAIGWLRPIVLVPAGALAGVPAAQMEALLLHELAHIRRHDYLVHLLQSAVEAIFFYHPAVWLVSSHIRAERELCCDDIAVSVTGDAVIYARALAEFDSARWIQPTVMAANGGFLADRIARLLGYPRPEWRPSPAAPGIAAVLILATAALFAQSAAPPHFEVASIKPSSAPRFTTSARPMPGGRFHAVGPLRLLIRVGYNLHEFQVLGGPAWIDNDPFEVDAKAEGNPTREQLLEMLQPLLEERFHLKVHRESRELPVYALGIAKSGSKLPAPKDSCIPFDPTAPLPPVTSPPCGRLAVVGSATAWQLRGAGIGIPELVGTLANTLGRAVLDRTGLTGTYDIHAEFTPDSLTAGMAGMFGPPAEPDKAPPSIITAVQEQLGLRLESTKGPVDVLVIDHVERPTAN
jgi:uncharacterized protein (TIGR03435 family)